MLLWSASDARLAHACRCLEPSLGVAYRRADLVVDADVVAVQPRPELQGAEVTLRVHRSWKRDTTRELVVRTGSTCAIAMMVGEARLLFLDASPDGSYTTGRCMGNRRLRASHVIPAWLHTHGATARVLPSD